MDKATITVLLYVAGAVIGQLLFWVARWANGEDWVVCNFRRTVAAVLGNFTAMATILSAGIPAGMAELPLASVLFAGLTLGISADSLLNKGQRKDWSATERERRT